MVDCNDMTISVLMAVYKAEKAENLDRALKSIWTFQSKRPDEIVLVEDGPLNPALYGVLDSWQKELGEKLVRCKNEKNIGLTKSLNKGLLHVSSDLIARMDSDDISDPKRFEWQHDFMEKHPDVAVVGGSLKEVEGHMSQDDNGITFVGDKYTIRTYPDKPDVIKKYILKASPLCHATVMMRTSMFKEGGIKYNESYITSQDIALWYDVLCAGFKISNIKEVTYYLEQEDIIKRRSRKKAWNEFKIYINGIYRMNGLFTLAYGYPFARLFFRLIPRSWVKAIYGSSVRTKFLDTKKTE